MCLNIPFYNLTKYGKLNYGGRHKETATVNVVLTMADALTGPPQLSLTVAVSLSRPPRLIVTYKYPPSPRSFQVLRAVHFDLEGLPNFLSRHRLRFARHHRLPHLRHTPSSSPSTHVEESPTLGCAMMIFYTEHMPLTS